MAKGSFVFFVDRTNLSLVSFEARKKIKDYIV